MSALVDAWAAELDGQMASMRKHLSFLLHCDTDYLKALHRVRESRLTFEGESRMTGRVHYWERARRLGRVPKSFDIEKQILAELAS